MLKSIRIARNLTLRQCAGELQADPSNWSKLERGVTPAPKDTALFPELRLVKRGFLGKDAGWDDVTWWLFERTE